MLDLRVAADAGACRSVGEWLGGLAGGMRESAGVVARARVSSDGFWSGSTGEVFRERMSSAVRVSDRAAGATEGFGRALRVFADDMDTVGSRMNLARQVAGAGGLPVSAEGIAEPSGMGKVDGTQVAAYREASVIVADARRIESRAHRNLASSVAANTTDWSMTALDWVTGAVGALYGEHLAWTSRAARFERIAAQWDRLVDNTMLSTEGRLTALGKSARAELNARLAREIADSNDSPIKFLPEFVRKGAYANVGNSIEDVRYLNRLSGAMERVPYVGLLFLGGGVIAANAEGQSMTKAAISGGASFAAGTLATEGTLAGAGMMADMGLLALSGGPVTIVAVGVGIGVSIGVGYVVDHYGDDIVNAAQNGLHATEHGVEAAGHAVNKGVHAIGHALGHIF